MKGSDVFPNVRERGGKRNHRYGCYVSCVVKSEAPIKRKRIVIEMGTEG